MSREKIRLGIIYGGKSSEHEVSLRTALSIMKAVDANKYEITPIYVSLDGTWTMGDAVTGQLPDKIASLRLQDAAGNAENRDAQLVSTTRKASPFAIGEQVDVIFPVVHGPNGEDGTIQGLLELANLPY
ncbi:MAG TPA: D-alanine--D-alanine ligase, partial [Brevibacillus sp.]|nr:D-alanine--D-alanine ligase [Brevibacillus sp.]